LHALSSPSIYKEIFKSVSKCVCMLIIYDTPILPFSAIGGFSLSTTDTGICIMYSPSTCTLSCQSLTPVPISVFSLHCLAYAIMPITSKHIMQRFPLSNIELFGLYHL